MNMKIISEMNYRIGVIEGAMASLVESPVSRVVYDAIDCLNEILDGIDTEEIENLRAENARLSRLNSELESQMRRMVAHQRKCDCDWRQEDDGK